MARMSLAPWTALSRFRGVVPAWRAALGLAMASSFVLACYTEAPAKKKKPFDADDDGFYGADITHEAEEPLGAWTNQDSGAFGAAERPVDGDKTKPPPQPPPPYTGGPKEFCEGPLAMGDLVVTEIMIASRSGSGDTGEWIEIQSTRDCWLRVEGVTIVSPRGAAAPNSVTIAEAFEVAPQTSFVVADSTDPVKNNNLPGKVFSWNGSDVLKNDGDTIIVKIGETVIDQLTYPSLLNITGGRSIAFPSNCPRNARSDWNRWSLSFTSFSGSFKGTPNAWNNDVACF
jgi:hypothetical protein